jgi:hypothetical protein
MASNIKGITVEIGGDTGPLDKALKGVNQTTRDLQSELKQVEKALKLDPGNTVLLEQKQKILADSVQNTKTKLDSLKEAQRQVAAQFSKGDIGEEQYRAFQREVIKTEQELKRLETQAKNSNVELSKIKGAAEGVASASGKVAGTMAPATVAIVAMGTAAFNAGSDLIESQNKVDVAFKDSAGVVNDWSETTLEKFGIAKGTSLEMASLFGDMGTSMGLSTGAAATMSTSLGGLAGDLASFKNIGIDQAQDALKGVFTGEGESLKTLGVVMQDSTLSAYAAANGYTKTYTEMTQAEKVGLRYAFVMDATKNAQGDFARTSDGAANSVRVAKESMKEAGETIGVSLAPIVAKAAQAIAGLVQGFTNLDPGTKKVILVVLALIAAIAPVAGIISGVAVVVAFLASPFGLVVLAVAAAIAAFALLRAAFALLDANAANIKTNITNTFNAIKTGISNAINGAKDAVGNAINAIKGFFNFTFSWPKLPLPHFAVSPSGWKIGDLLKGSIPSLGISWYDKGGIFNNPAIVGVGEKRPEFVGALDDLRYLIRDELNSFGAVGSGISQVIVPVSIEGREVARASSPHLDKIQGSGVKRAGRRVGV